MLFNGNSISTLFGAHTYQTDTMDIFSSCAHLCIQSGSVSWARPPARRPLSLQKCTKEHRERSLSSVSMAQTESATLYCSPSSHRQFPRLQTSMIFWMRTDLEREWRRLALMQHRPANPAACTERKKEKGNSRIPNHHRPVHMWTSNERVRTSSSTETCIARLCWLQCSFALSLSLSQALSCYMMGLSCGWTVKSGGWMGLHGRSHCSQSILRGNWGNPRAR